jgi:hypothetical protein
MSWSKRGGYTALALVAVAAAAAILARGRRTEVWHSLDDSDQD